MKLLTRLLPIIGGAVAGGAIALAVANGSTTTHSVTTTTVVQPSSSPALPTSFNGTAKALTISQIFQQDDPGVVDITTSSTQNNTGVFGFGQSQQTEGEGAGVVFDKKGDIVTDEHVVSGASTINVTFPDGFKSPATLVGSDTGADLAVIRRKERCRLRAAPADLRATPRPCRSATASSRSAARSVCPTRSPPASSARSSARSRPPTVHDPERGADRRRDQPGQLGRAADQRRRPGDRAERPDRDQQHQRPGRGLELRRRFRHPVQQRRPAGQGDHRHRPGPQRLRRGQPRSVGPRWRRDRQVREHEQRAADRVRLAGRQGRPAGGRHHHRRQRPEGRLGRTRSWPRSPTTRPATRSR